jgi:hypothetical protein
VKKETITPTQDDQPNRVSLEMLKRVLAVAELVAKSLPPQAGEQDRHQKSPEKTQA